MKKNKNFNIDDTFKPKDLFEQWEEIKRNKYFLWWNVSNNFFEKEIEVGDFLAWAMLRWYTKEMLEKWYDFFGKDLVLEIAEKYRESIKKELNWILEIKK